MDSRIHVLQSSAAPITATKELTRSTAYSSPTESPLLGQMFFRASSFATFFYSLKMITSDSIRPTAGQYFLAGATTGFFISFIEVRYVSSVEIIEVKMDCGTFGLDCTCQLRTRSLKIVWLWCT